MIILYSIAYSTELEGLYSINSLRQIENILIENSFKLIDFNSLFCISSSAIKVQLSFTKSNCLGAFLNFSKVLNV